jgi:hypothetical protein
MTSPATVDVERPRTFRREHVFVRLALLTDRLPARDAHPVRLRVDRSGSPTVGSALRRILAAIPSLIVLAIITLAGAIVWLVATVLVFDGYPPLALESRPVPPTAASS